MAATSRSRGPRSRPILALIAIVFASIPRPVEGSHGGHVHHNTMGGGGGYPGGMAMDGHPKHLNFNPGISFGYNGFSGPFYYSPPLFVIGSSGFPPFFGAGNTFVPPPLPFPIDFGMGGGGLNLPAPPQGLVEPAPARLRRANPARAKELVEIGDRSFRAKNTKRAEEKYHLAVRADPTSPIPHVHLAQVALARGNYSAAADHLRDAVSVASDGNWLLNAPDIQAIFGEPADFAKQLARLESHLQANPNDRDAWFVLGAESYLSGRTRRAFDAFQRLTDRRPDEALTAFLDASKPRPAAEN